LFGAAVGAGPARASEDVLLTQSERPYHDAGRKGRWHEHKMNQRNGKSDQRRNQSGTQCHASSLEAIGAGENVQLDSGDRWLGPESSHHQLQPANFHWTFEECVCDRQKNARQCSRWRASVCGGL
jgi:hypothetical protein